MNPEELGAGDAPAISPPPPPPVETGTASAPPPSPGVGRRPAGTRAILSLIFGLLSTFGSPCFFLGIPLGIAAVVLGWMELAAIQKEKAAPSGRGFAIAGIVFGAVGILASLISIVFCIFLWKLGTHPIFDEMRRGVPI
ncbi:MAG: DUF4190 domain-containing protein [Nitrospirae bacterium]|nr:DUF4190 domain-containing protein [Nitrospirota bacterium]